MLRKYVKTLISRHHETFPSAHFIGTNCFVIGSTDTRVMIDAGAFPQSDPNFQKNLELLMEDEKFRVKSIFVTHYKGCHWGGVQSIIDLHQRFNLEVPAIYKRVDPFLDQVVLRQYPLLVLNDLKLDNMSFPVEDGLDLTVIQTPGPSPDHLSFVLESSQDSLLFPGDMLLASPSVCFTDLTEYMNSLRKLRRLKCSEICLSHITDRDEIFVPAQPAIQRYIYYREMKEKIILSKIARRGYFSKAELFTEMYGDRDLSDPFEQSLVECNFNQQLNKLVKESKIDIWGGNVFLHQQDAQQGYDLKIEYQQVIQKSI